MNELIPTQSRRHQKPNTGGTSVPGRNDFFVNNQLLHWRRFRTRVVASRFDRFHGSIRCNGEIVDFSLQRVVAVIKMHRQARSQVPGNVVLFPGTKQQHTSYQCWHLKAYSGDSKKKKKLPEASLDLRTSVVSLKCPHWANLAFQSTSESAHQQKSISSPTKVNQLTNKSESAHQQKWISSTNKVNQLTNKSESAHQQKWISSPTKVNQLTNKSESAHQQKWISSSIKVNQLTNKSESAHQQKLKIN